MNTASPSKSAASLSEPLLTCPEAAALLSVKPAWIYAAARSGRLTCVRVGRNVRLLRSDLEQFVAQQRTDAAHKGRR
jgi:excisionase family DNA binding protein